MLNKKAGAHLIALFLLGVLPVLALAAPAQRVDVATALNWQQDNRRVCTGFFNEPIPALISTDGQTQISADQTTAPLQGPWHLVGNVSLRQENLHIQTKEAYLEERQNKRSLVNLTQPVRIRQPGSLLLAETGTFDLATKRGKLNDSLYRIDIDDTQHYLATVAAGQAWQPNDVAWGKAAQLEQLDPQHLHAQQASYSTCAPSVQPVWQLRAKQIYFNKTTGRVTAKHVRLYARAVPVFYTPYLSFPTNKERQSGLLPPSVGYNHRNGVDLRLPYYFNLAPNYDFLLTPRLLFNRGLQLNSESRYLTQNAVGTFQLDLMPNDSVFNVMKRDAPATYANSEFLPDLLQASHVRKSVAWYERRQWSPHISTAVNYSRLSDNYWLNDLGNIHPLPETISSSNQLVQQAEINYNNDLVSASGKLMNYQTLERVNLAAINRPYNRLPELNTKITLPTTTALQSEVNLQYVNFSLASLQPGEATFPITGERLVVDPQISMPFSNTAAYFTPSLHLHMTQYYLRHQLAGRKDNVTRNIPIFQADSGLYFERGLRITQHDLTQTLEPRINYTYIPYRDQDSIPNFDSGRLYYNYNQLFSYNRFAGIDRIGDTQQVTVGATTRFIDNGNGTEKLTVSLGQIFYYSAHRVTLCLRPGCETTTLNPPHRLANWQHSIIAGEATYRMDNQWQANSNYSWDPATHHPVAYNAYFGYNQDQQHIINVGYNYAQDVTNYINNANAPQNEDLKQAAFSFVWPLQQKWLALSTWQQNLKRGYLQDYLLGVEYNSCCWAFRILGGRTFLELSPERKPKFNKAIYLQWQLTGVGSFGTLRRGALLSSMIPNYRGDIVPR